MNLKVFSCPNCGAKYNPAQYQCEYCGSYVFISNQNYADFSNVKINLPQKPTNETGKHPGVYIFGRLLGKGERPITLGAANYFTGLFSAGGKLLLTNKSLSFSAHNFNVGRKETKIDLKQITDVKVVGNLVISQQILITANGKLHKFVVYHGNEWVQKIKEAINQYDKVDTPIQQPVNVQRTTPAQYPFPAQQPAYVRQPTSAQQPAYIQELQQLKQLLDMGIITEEEFNIKKRMLLGL